uniref:Platelet-derived growth factor subunit A-like n=1 Tax=Callorhinchus milii TaxID=7868 RepID=A0A4W3K345_CALMI
LSFSFNVIQGYSSTKPASCKPRPISVEIPRYKVDPSSAGFFLWPSCVEVDRCSGCCNTKTYKCIPSLTQFKSFQIAKLTYRYGRKELSVHTVTVQEHISCNCTELPRRHIMRPDVIRISPRKEPLSTKLCSSTCLLRH